MYRVKSFVGGGMGSGKSGCTVVCKDFAGPFVTIEWLVDTLKYETTASSITGMSQSSGLKAEATNYWREHPMLKFASVCPPPAAK